MIKPDAQEDDEDELPDDSLMDDQQKKLRRLRTLLRAQWGRDPQEDLLQSCGFLVIELPILPVEVIHEEKQYPAVTAHVPPVGQLDLANYIVESSNDESVNDISLQMYWPYFFLISQGDNDIIEFSLAGRPFNAAALTVVPDWDMGQINLSEELNRRLNHNARRGNQLLDASVKPNLAERDRLDRLISAVRVTGGLNGDDMDLLYRFRYALTDNKKALTKFLLAVNWDDESEVGS